VVTEKIKQDLENLQPLEEEEETDKVLTVTVTVTLTLTLTLTLNEVVDDKIPISLDPHDYSTFVKVRVSLTLK